jgi:hypothetical protein
MIRSILHSFASFYKPAASAEGGLERVAESDGFRSGDTSGSGSRVTSTGSGRRSGGSLMSSGYVSVQDEQDEQDLQAMCSYLAHLPPHIAPTWESSDTALAELRAAHVEVFASPERAALYSAVTHLEAFGTEFSAVKRVAAHMSHVYLTEPETIPGRISSAEYSRRLLRNSRHSSDGSAGSAGAGGSSAEDGEKRLKVTFSTMLAQHLAIACAPTSRTSVHRLEDALARNLTSRAVVLALLAVLHAARSEEARQSERDVVRELARVYDEQAGNERAYVTYAAVKRALLTNLPASAVRAHKCLVRGVLLICMHIQSEEVLPGNCTPDDDEGRAVSGSSRGSSCSSGFAGGRGDAGGAAFRGSRERAFVAAAIDVLQGALFISFVCSLIFVCSHILLFTLFFVLLTSFFSSSSQAHDLRFFLPACAVSKGAVAKSVHVSAARDGTPLNATCGRGEFSFIYRYIVRESCSQFDSLPLTSLTIAQSSSSARRAPSFSSRSETRRPRCATVTSLRRKPLQPPSRAPPRHARARSASQFRSAATAPSPRCGSAATYWTSRSATPSRASSPRRRVRTKCR